MSLVVGSVLDSDASDEPIAIHRGDSPADRTFRGLLACSAAIVFVLLMAIMIFLLTNGWWALTHIGFTFFIGTYWSAPAHPGVLGLLIGSVEIGLVGLFFAFPVSIATALMINEYSHHQMRRYLIALIDLLATVPSIVYGFWGLEFLSHHVSGTSQWLVAHLGFIPIFRTQTPGSYEDSVFICGLVVAIMIIPVMTSIIREVMAQTPRDACEAALALGGTKWGMVTDVILPFSRSGIVGGTLLGFSRALGETIAILLILSSTFNRVTAALMGPGPGSVAKQIAADYTTADAHGRSELTLAGLVLFATTLIFSFGGRLIVRGSGSPGR